MKKIKAILIGAGARGAKAYAPYALTHPDELQFVAVAEPQGKRRNDFSREHHIPDEYAFDSYEELLNAQIEADLVLVCTQDRLHYGPAKMAMEKGYDVLLEKPIGSYEETVDIGNITERTGRKLIVCHVLRYTPFFRKIKELIDSGLLGDIVAITHNENVGYYHAAHSYVRGNWRKTEESSPMLLAKSCHDIDILLWLISDRCKRVSSFGSRMHFREENAPAGSATRCVDCGVRGTCPYDALKIYMDEENTGWPVSVITDDFSREGRLRALREGPYGRCVYRCDNDVVDHQAVLMEFEKGATVAFHMNAFTHDISRTIRVSGTRGELIGNMEESRLTHSDFLTKKQTEIPIDRIVGNDYGHGGGDYGLMNAVVRYLQDPVNNPISSGVHSAVESHLVTFAAEEARLSNAVIDLLK